MTEAPYLVLTLVACGSMTLLIIARAARDVMVQTDPATQRTGSDT
jgi:hypothetical protein